MTLKEAWECIVETMNNNKTTQVVIVSKGDPDYDKCLSLDWLVEKFKNAINNTRGCFGVPKEEIDKLADALLPAMIEFFQSEEGQREFAAWLEKREKEEAVKKKDGDT